MWLAMIPLIAVLIGLLALAAGWRMRTTLAHGQAARRGPRESTTARGFFRTGRGRVAVLVPLTLLLVGLWLTFDLPLAVVPAVTVPIWAAQFADGDLSPVARRRLAIAMLVAGALFLVTLALGVAVFVAK